MTYQRLGECALDNGNKAAALSNFETARPIFENLTAKSPENLHRQNELAIIRSNIAKLKDVS